MDADDLIRENARLKAALDVANAENDSLIAIVRALRQHLAEAIKERDQALAGRAAAVAELLAD